jgi:hypothetical protein
MIRLLRTAVVVAAIGLGTSASASAAPITYTFSGTVDGFTCVACTGSDNTPLPGGAFTFVVTGDTTAINNSDPFFTLHNLDGTFTQGLFSATLTGVTVESNDSLDLINFYNSSFLNGLGMSNPALSGYQLSTSIGPLNVTDPGAGPNSTFSGGFFTTTGTEQVQFTSSDSLTFSSASAVPEPATISLVAIGLASLRYSRRKR